MYLAIRNTVLALWALHPKVGFRFIFSCFLCLFNVHISFVVHSKSGDRNI